MPTELAVISIKGHVNLDSSLLPTNDKITMSLTIILPDNVVDMGNYDTNMDLKAMPTRIEGEEVTWNLYKLKQKLVITCKGKEVWSTEYTDLIYRKNNGQSVGTNDDSDPRAWEKSVVELTFTNEDTATLGYRQTGWISTYPYQQNYQAVKPFGIIHQYKVNLNLMHIISS